MSEIILKNTASRRALAEVINIISVEIIIRRDTSKTLGRKAALKLLFVSYKAFLSAWKDLETTDPVSYSMFWDNQLEKTSNTNKIISDVQDIMTSIVNDVSADLYELLPVMDLDTFSESSKVLSHIVNIDHSYSLIGKV